MATSQDFVNWVCDESRLHYDYLKYVLLAEGSSFLRFSSGTTHQTIYFPEVKAFHVCMPDLATQKRISSVLRALDDKIELNRQINTTLESMAQALFKSWFVDFDPVIDNALAAGNPIPDALQARADKRAGLRVWTSDEGARRASATEGASQQRKALRQQAGGTDQAAPLQRLPAEIRALFPDSFIFNEEMGWVPEGWEVSNFGDVAVCFDSKRVPLSKQEREKKKPGNIPYYGATSVMDYIDEWIFDGIYLLIGEDGSVIRDDGTPFCQYIWGRSWVNNHAHVLQGKDGVSSEHLLLFMQHQNIGAYVTGAVQLKINQKNMNSIPFLKASNEINAHFSSLIEPYYAKYRNACDQVKALSQVRDSLLPKLLSGQLEVPIAEERVAEVI